MCVRVLALRLVADPRHMYIPQVSLPAAGVDANVWWLARELDGIKQAVQAQGAAVEAKLEKQDERLTAIEKALVSWKINFAWVAAGFAGLEFVLANKEVVVGVLESIGQHK